MCLTLTMIVSIETLRMTYGMWHDYEDGSGIRGKNIPLTVFLNRVPEP